MLVDRLTPEGELVTTLLPGNDIKARATSICTVCEPDSPTESLSTKSHDIYNRGIIEHAIVEVKHNGMEVAAMSSVNEKDQINTICDLALTRLSMPAETRLAVLTVTSKHTNMLPFMLWKSYQLTCFAISDRELEHMTDETMRNVAVAVFAEQCKLVADIISNVNSVVGVAQRGRYTTPNRYENFGEEGGLTEAERIMHQLKSRDPVFACFAALTNDTFQQQLEINVDMLIKKASEEQGRVNAVIDESLSKTANAASAIPENPASVGFNAGTLGGINLSVDVNAVQRHDAATYLKEGMQSLLHRQVDTSIFAGVSIDTFLEVGSIINADDTFYTYTHTDQVIEVYKVRQCEAGWGMAICVSEATLNNKQHEAVKRVAKHKGVDSILFAADENNMLAVVETEYTQGPDARYVGRKKSAKTMAKPLASAKPAVMGRLVKPSKDLYTLTPSQEQACKRVTDIMNLGSLTGGSWELIVTGAKSEDSRGYRSLPISYALAGLSMRFPTKTGKRIRWFRLSDTQQHGRDTVIQMPIAGIDTGSAISTRGNIPLESTVEVLTSKAKNRYRDFVAAFG